MLLYIFSQIHVEQKPVPLSLPAPGQLPHLKTIHSGCQNKAGAAEYDAGEIQGKEDTVAAPPV